MRLLRVQQEREFERVGGNRTVRVDIRVLAATHRNLEQMVRAGQFRQDLFFRLNVVPIDVPPLRARPGDLAALAKHFLDHFCRQQGKRLVLAPAALERLARYDWPGNVRELRNIIERAVVLADDGLALEEDDLAMDAAVPPAPEPAPAQAAATGSVFEEINQAEAARIKDALRQARGNKARAARLLGIARTTLNDRIQRLGIA